MPITGQFRQEEAMRAQLSSIDVLLANILGVGTNHLTDL